MIHGIHALVLITPYTSNVAHTCAGNLLSDKFPSVNMWKIFIKWLLLQECSKFVFIWYSWARIAKAMHMGPGNHSNHWKPLLNHPGTDTTCSQGALLYILRACPTQWGGGSAMVGSVQRCRISCESQWGFAPWFPPMWSVGYSHLSRNSHMIPGYSPYSWVYTLHFSRRCSDVTGLI